MHREYAKLVEPIIPHPPLKDNVCTNLSFVSAHRRDATYHCMTAASTQPDQSYVVPTVSVPCTTAPVTTLSTNTHPVLATHPSRTVQSIHTSHEQVTVSLGGVVACQEREETTTTRHLCDQLGDGEGLGESARVGLVV